MSGFQATTTRLIITVTKQLKQQLKTNNNNNNNNANNKYGIRQVQRISNKIKKNEGKMMGKREGNKRDA